MTAMNVLQVDAMESAQKTLRRRGFEVVVDGHKLRFYGGDRECVQELRKVLDSQEDEVTPLGTLLNEMGFDVDVENGPDGECVIAYPSV